MSTTDPNIRAAKRPTRRPAKALARVRALGHERESLTVDLRLDTPTFTFGRHPRGDRGDAKGDAEARLSAILGVLRFWWRAAAWAPAWRAEGKKADPALQRLNAWEDAIFGAVGTEDGGGQGAVDWSMEEPVGDLLSPAWTNKPGDVGFGRAYMGNQGLKDHRPLRKGVALRLHATRRTIWRRDPADDRTVAALAALGLLDPWNPLTLTPRPWAGAVAAPTVADALLLLHLFGLVGSRSRRGFGSAVVASATARRGAEVSTLAFPQTIAAVRDAIAETLSSYAGQSRADDIPRAPFTALSASARVVFSAFPGGDAEQAHEALAYSMLRFRGYGHFMVTHDGRELRKIGKLTIPADDQTQRSATTLADHDTWYAPIKSAAFEFPSSPPENPEAAPKRAGFGLPLNSFTRLRGGAISQAERDYAAALVKVLPGRVQDVSKEMHINLPGAGDVSRRASPLILKVRDCEDGAVGQWAILPAENFLPRELDALTADVIVTYQVRFVDEGRRERTTKVSGPTHRIQMPVPSMDDAFRVANQFVRFISSPTYDENVGRLSLLSPSTGPSRR